MHTTRKVDNVTLANKLYATSYTASPPVIDISGIDLTDNNYKDERNPSRDRLGYKHFTSLLRAQLGGGWRLIDLLARGCNISLPILVHWTTEAEKFISFRILDLSNNPIADDFMQVLLSQFKFKVLYAFGPRYQALVETKFMPFASSKWTPKDTDFINVWTQNIPGKKMLSIKTLFIFFKDTLSEEAIKSINAAASPESNRLSVVFVSGPTNKAYLYDLAKDTTTDLGVISSEADITTLIKDPKALPAPTIKATVSVPLAAAGAGAPALPEDGDAILFFEQLRARKEAERLVREYEKAKTSDLGRLSDQHVAENKCWCSPM